MRGAYWKYGLSLAVVVSIGYGINNQYLNPTGPYQVTNAQFPQPWEPSSTAGNAWVHTYFDYRYPGYGLHTAVRNSGWTTSGVITGGGSQLLGDGFVAWDSSRGQYLLVATDANANSSVWFGTSTDGLCWNNCTNVLRQIMIPPGDGSGFDYASIAVDSSNPRRIIVGAVHYQNIYDTTQCVGYNVAISTDGGQSWTPAPYTDVAVQPGPGPAPNRWGITGRVVGAGNQFYVFLSMLAPGAQFAPLAVYYYAENGGAWSLQPVIMNFQNNPPLNNNVNCISALDSNSCNPPTNGYIYYAPLIDANGNDSGKWSVTFQARTGGGGQYNNVYECSGTGMVQNGCYAPNVFSADEYLNAVSVGPEGGIWISLLTFSGVNYPNLQHEMLYLPPGQGWLGTAGYYNINERSWPQDNSQDRCTVLCYAMGDYARIASNPYVAVDAPFTDFQQNPSYIPQLFQLFYQDPQGTVPSSAFKPNPIYYPPGTILSGPSVPNPTQARGIAPELRVKMPGFNRH